jgi:cbb3-type cytochrome oxidase subunit 3
MTATIFSLLAVTAGFSALLAWVYWPGRRQDLESLGRIPLDDDEPGRRNDS